MYHRLSKFMKMYDGRLFAIFLVQLMWNESVVNLFTPTMRNLF